MIHEKSVACLHVRGAWGVGALPAAPPTTHSHKLVQLALSACLQGIVADMSKRKKQQLTLRYLF